MNEQLPIGYKVTIACACAAIICIAGIICPLWPSSSSSRVNYAERFVHMANPDLSCEDFGQGWGFVPDAVACRVPEGILYCTAGANTMPACRPALCVNGMDPHGQCNPAKPGAIDSASADQKRLEHR